MKELSDKELQNIFEEKLRDFEYDVPEEYESVLFESISKKAKLQARHKKVQTIVLVFLITLCTITIIDREFEEVITKVNQQNGSSSSAIKNCEPEKIIYSYYETNLNTQVKAAPNEISVTNPANQETKYLKLLSIPKTAFGIASDSILVGKVVESLEGDSSLYIYNDRGTPKLESRFWLTFGIQPFISYRHITPIAGDGVVINNFDLPNKINSSRLGNKMTVTTEFRGAMGKTIGIGLSYLTFSDKVEYQSSEQVHFINQSNKVDSHLHGLGITFIARYPLLRKSKTNHLLSGAFDYLKLQRQLPANSATMSSASIGYSIEWAKSNRLVRLTPSMSYSLSGYNYPGIRLSPFWFGITFEYAFAPKLKISENVIE